MRRFKKIFGIVTVLMLVLTMLPVNVFAATGSYSASISSKTITEGKSATLTIKTIKGSGQEKNPEGKFTVSSSNSAVAKVGTSSLWVGESGKATVSVKAVKTGTATITITPVSVSDEEYNLITGSKTITVTVKAKATTTTTDNKQDEKEEKPVTVKKSSDATLKSLDTKVGSIDFSKNTTNYTVEVDKTVTTLGLEAVANSPKASVKITGDKDFKVGTNLVDIVVTAEDGTIKTYTINVIKSKFGKAPLVNLEVEGYAISPEFETDKFTYSVDVVDRTSVDIKYELLYKDATVVITGNDNLKVGLNPVKVVVTEKDGTVTTYTVNVKAGVSEEIEQDTSIWLIIIIIFILVIIAETIYIVVKNKEEKKKAEEQAKKKTAKKSTKTTSKK